MITKKLIGIVLTVLIGSASFAQGDFGFGQTPPGLDWRQIRTDRFTLIFPEAITDDAQRLANTLEHIYTPVSKTLRGPQKPLELALINQTAESNGFVGLAPRRSVWSTTPLQSAGFVPGDWLQLLALHEMRHVVQYDRGRRGFVRLWWLLFGEMGETLSSLLTPNWYAEGDAVGIETALTESGRGRLPKFGLHIRALLLARQRYSYYKAFHRSYRDWYPDYYKLGYFMTTYVRRRYGADTWDKVLGSTANWAFHPFAFHQALKKHTGAGASTIYEQTMDELTELWQTQQRDLPVTEARVLAGQSRSSVWTNYTYPHPLPDGSVLASKSGLANTSQLVRLHPDGSEERVCFYSPLVDGIRVAGGTVTWNRYTPDLRWGRRSYSDVVVLDIASGKMRQLTHNAKLFAPAPSPDGTRLAAIEFGSDRSCHLVLLETASGNEQARFAAPDRVFWRTPAWSEDGRHIAVVRMDEHGNTIERIDAASGEGQMVLAHTHDDIGWPVFWGSYLLFDSPHSGIDNIHAVHLSTGARYQVTSRPLAANHAAVTGDSLLFEEYTVDGYRVADMPLDAANWTPFEQVEDRHVRYYEPMIDQEQGGSVFEADIPQRTYPVRVYRPLAHLFKIHSWQPYSNGRTHSLNLASSDLLNLSELSGGGEYNSNEKAFSVLSNLRLSAWYPIFSVGGRWGERVEVYTAEDNSDDEDVTDTWAEKSLNVGVEVPLSLSRGVWSSTAYLSMTAELTDITDKDYPNLFDSNGLFEGNQNGRFTPVTYQFALSRSRSMASRDLAPSWEQSLQLIYRHTPLAGDYDGKLLSGRLGLNFPGFWSHHSLRLEGAYEWQDPTAGDANPYRFESESDFVRGYDYRFHRHFYQGSANYGLPLLYPDWDLGALVYLKRVKTNLFYDYGLGKDGSERTTYQTAGVELTADFVPFSLPIPLDMGVRGAYRFDEKDVRVEAVINFPEL